MSEMNPRQAYTEEAIGHIEAGSREFFLMVGQGRHPSTAQILKHFAYSHLPESLRPYSQNCADLALQMAAMLPDGPELTTGLRKLLEAKDCFVRAALERAAPPKKQQTNCPQCGLPWETWAREPTQAPIASEQAKPLT